MSGPERTSAPSAAAIAVIALWLYCAGLTLWLISYWRGAAASDLGPWWVLPSQFVGFGLVVARIGRRDLAGPRLAAWYLLAASILIDAVATACFAYIAGPGADTYGVWVDAVYILDYFVMSAICALFLVACGGDFRRRRVWRSVSPRQCCRSSWIPRSWHSRRAGPTRPPRSATRPGSSRRRPWRHCC
jgi:hypothetical protein